MWNIFLNQWLSIFFYMLVFVYSSKSILILWVGRMINTRIIRWILADILTIADQYVSRKLHNSKKYAFLFFYSETNHNIPWYEPILTRLEASFLAMRIQNSLLNSRLLSVLQWWIHIDTFFSRKRIQIDSWIVIVKSKTLSIFAMCIFLYLDHPFWNLVHTRWQFSTNKSVSFKHWFNPNLITRLISHSV